MSFPPPGSGADRPLLPPSAWTDPSLPRPLNAPPTPSTWQSVDRGALPPPPGYVADTANVAPVQLRSTDGLRTAAIVMLWAATAASFGWTATLYSRVSVWDDFMADSAGLRELDDADSLVFIAIGSSVALSIVAAILLAVWSFRTVRNAHQLGGRDLKPKLAGWSWFIPIGNMWVPFVQLRRTATAVGIAGTRVSQWQAVWVTTFVLGRYGVSAFDFSALASEAEVRSALSREATFSVVVGLGSFVSALLAQRAMTQVDRAVANRHDVVRQLADQDTR